MDCNKELVMEVGQYMTQDEFWKKFGKKIEHMAEEGIDCADEDDEDENELREREEEKAREYVIEEENIKFTD